MTLFSGKGIVSQEYPERRVAGGCFFSEIL